MTIDEMVDRKRELGYTYEQISRLSGLPLATVQKVLGKITKSPRYDTVCALEKVLKKEAEVSPGKSETVSGRQSAPYTYQSADYGSSMLRDPGIPYGPKKYWESMPVKVGEPSKIAEAAPDYAGTRLRKGNGQWGRQGEYTLEDYYILPDDLRVELIDGVFYDQAAPATLHQDLAGQIYFAFTDYTRKKKGTCRPYIAPVDVQLDQDNRTMLQPDVLIVCDREKLKDGIVYGAPDLVVEILSPSTKEKDQLIKFNKYFHSGVREYWIVNPKTKQILVYDFADGIECRAYNGEDKVPVIIFNGECIVDFKEVFEYVDFLEDSE